MIIYKVYFKDLEFLICIVILNKKPLAILPEVLKVINIKMNY